MEKAESWLDKTLHYRFHDASLLTQALTHRSANGSNNERLEFLGDAVLDFVISDAVFTRRPDAAKGTSASYVHRWSRILRLQNWPPTWVSVNT